MEPYIFYIYFIFWKMFIIIKNRNEIWLFYFLWIPIHLKCRKILKLFGGFPNFVKLLIKEIKKLKKIKKLINKLISGIL